MAVNEALIPCVITSITILLVMLVNGICTVLFVVLLFVGSIATSWHFKFKFPKSLLIVVSSPAAQKDTLGFSFIESTLYVRLTALMEALALSVNRT